MMNKESVEFDLKKEYNKDMEKCYFSYDFIPKSLRSFFEKILLKKYTAYFYGESLFKDTFYQQKSYRYQIAIEMNTHDFLNLDFLNLNLNFFTNSKKYKFNFFFKNDKMTYFQGDYPEEDIIPDFYLQIFLCTDFLANRNSIFSIENLSYNGVSFFYLDKEVKESCLNKEAFLIDLEKNLTTIHKDLCYILRLARYIIEFSLNPEWLNLNLEDLKSLKSDQKNKRIKKEIISILDFKLPSIILDFLRQKKVLELFFSEILEGFEMYQNKFHAYDVYWHCLKSSDFSDPNDSIIRIASLFHDIGKPRSKNFSLRKGEKKNTFYNHENIGAKMTFFILKRFGFTLKSRKRISNLVRLHMFYYTKCWTNRAVRRFIKKSGQDRNALFRLRSADRLGSGKKGVESKSLNFFKNHIEEIIRKDKEFKVTDLVVSGNDLKSHFKLNQGPIIGSILNYLKDLVSKNEIENIFSILILYAEKWIKENKEEN